jgi:hypothetical protein
MVTLRLPKQHCCCTKQTATCSGSASPIARSQQLLPHHKHNTPMAHDQRSATRACHVPATLALHTVRYQGLVHWGVVWMPQDVCIAFGSHGGCQPAGIAWAVPCKPRNLWLPGPADFRSGGGGGLQRIGCGVLTSLVSKWASQMIGSSQSLSCACPVAGRWRVHHRLDTSQADHTSTPTSC